VLYCGDRVVGGGWISSTEAVQAQPPSESSTQP
jgi:hypothetical protein